MYVQKYEPRKPHHWKIIIYLSLFSFLKPQIAPQTSKDYNILQGRRKNNWRYLTLNKKYFCMVTHSLKVFVAPGKWDYKCQSNVCIFYREERRKEISLFSFECAVHLIRYLRLKPLEFFAVSLPTGILNRYTAHRLTSPKDKDCYQNVSGEETEWPKIIYYSHLITNYMIANTH